VLSGIGFPDCSAPVVTWLSLVYLAGLEAELIMPMLVIGLCKGKWPWGLMDGLSGSLVPTERQYGFGHLQHDSRWNSAGMPRNRGQRILGHWGPHNLSRIIPDKGGYHELHIEGVPKPRQR